VVKVPDRTTTFFKGKIMSRVMILCLVLFFVPSFLLAQEPQDKDVSVSEEVSEEPFRESYEELLKDRDNLLAQIKRLLKENKGYRSLKNNFDKVAAERDNLLNEKNKLVKQIGSFKDEIKRGEEKIVKLSLKEKKLEEEKELLEESVDRLESRKETKRLKNRADSLREEKKELARGLKDAQKKLGRLEEKARKAEEELKTNRVEFEKEIDEYQAQLDKLKEDHAEALKERKMLVDRLEKLPDKFVELARNHKELIKDTTNMHYNLGVFYAKNKEYKRAVAEFKETLKLKPNHAYANYNLGYVYAECLVDRPRAIKFFKKYLKFCDVNTDEDKDKDWVKKYILTWEAWHGKKFE
jgi:chromosome segregation ATPase